MTSTIYTADRIARALGIWRYRIATEVQLHDGIAAALRSEGIEFEHEHTVNTANRFDFLCGRIVIEAKLNGSLAEALRQAERYAQLACVDGVVIAAAKHWGRGAAAYEFHGKPVRIVQIRAQAF